MAAGLPASLRTRTKLRSSRRGRLGAFVGGVGGFVSKAFQMMFERLVAFRDALLVRVRHRHFLLEDE